MHKLFLYSSLSSIKERIIETFGVLNITLHNREENKKKALQLVHLAPYWQLMKKKLVNVKLQLSFLKNSQLSVDMNYTSYH